MADNIVLNAGAGGATLATDDIGGIQWPFGKMAWGPLDTANVVADVIGKRVPVQLGELAGTAIDVNSGVKSAGTLRVVLATDQPALTSKLLVTPDSVALPANQSTNLSQIAGTTPSVSSGSKDAGTLRVVLATDQPALTNKLLVTPDSVALPANQSVNVTQIGGVATDGGGATASKTISAASVNSTLLKSSSGQIYGIQVFNLNAAARYLKLYNKATAPTVGTDTPIKVIMIPGNTTGAGVVALFSTGIAFSIGIGFGLTTGITDADTGAVAANEIVVNIDYK
jgi:hypothetical protein